SYVAQPAAYQMARAVVAGFVLLPPTAMMGATLPLVVQHFALSRNVLGARIGFFYGLNTVGAVAGVLIGGFVLLPNLGVVQTTQIAAAANLLIGTVALWIAVRSGAIEVEPGSKESYAANEVGRRRRSLVPVALGVSGFAALALEVVWTRILIQS